MANNLETALYVVATPIGNLDDITLRAIETLKSVDVIAAEDTRNTSVLLEKYGIATRLISYHKYSEVSRCELFLNYLNEEKSIAVLNQILASTKRLADEGTAKELLGNKFFILADASKASTTASRGAALVIIACFLVGAMLSFGVILIQYLLDDTYNSKEAIEKNLNINVIASLPDISDVETGGSN